MPTTSKGMAVDLGFGPGYQTMVLCDLGYETVVALDTSRAPLGELIVAGVGRPIKAVLEDLRAFPRFVREGGADAIVCMGDTLTDLESQTDVPKLLQDGYRALRSNGWIVLTFLD